MDDKNMSTEQIEVANEKHQKLPTGTVHLIEDGSIILVPTPTSDPNDPLNMPTWQKYTILIVVGLFAASANLMTSGISAILPLIKDSYDNDPRANDLATWPAFFMGVGNLLAIPVAHAVGRRPVYLLSTIVLSMGCLWCACSKSLGSHIAGRDIMSIAAGQAEALCPIIVQEIFYLHQRGKVIAWFCALQTLGTAGLIVASPYIATGFGWKWWYGVFGAVNGGITVFSILFVKETKYIRTLAALNGEGSEEDGGELVPVTTSTRRQLDLTKYQPRNFLRDMLPWAGHTHWSEAVTCWKQMVQVITFPNIQWLILINSAALGVYILMAALFATVLIAPPFDWGFDALGYVFVGQIATAVAVPIFCGFLSDVTVKFMSKKNNGISEPEYRLIALIIPFIAMIISTVIYGYTAQHPTDWSWGGIVLTINFHYFGFVGVVVSSFVYAMDAYPQRVDAILVLFCSLRGFIGFGISFGTIAFVEKSGYQGAFNICAGIIGALAILGFPIYFFGKRIRMWSNKWVQDV